MQRLLFLMALLFTLASWIPALGQPVCIPKPDCQPKQCTTAQRVACAAQATLPPQCQASSSASATCAAAPAHSSSSWDLSVWFDRLFDRLVSSVVLVRAEQQKAEPVPIPVLPPSCSATATSVALRE